MKHSMKRVAGIDVGKSRLDVCLGAGSVQGFENTRQGIVRLIEWLRAEGAEQVILEASGRYERFLLDLLLGVQAKTGGAPCVVHVGSVGDSSRSWDAVFLPWIAGPGQTGQGGFGCGDAQDVVASACDCPERYAVGRDPGASQVKKQ